MSAKADRARLDKVAKSLIHEGLGCFVLQNKNLRFLQKNVRFLQHILNQKIYLLYCGQEVIKVNKAGVKNSLLKVVEKVSRVEFEKNCFGWPTVCAGIYHQPKRPSKKSN